MENKIVLCDCCNVNPATIKDYREREYNLLNFLVCNECVNLPDDVFFRRLAAFKGRIKRQNVNNISRQETTKEPNHEAHQNA